MAISTKPAKARRLSDERFLAFDTEDDSNGEVSIINFFDGQTHTTFYGRDLQVEAWNWLTRQAPILVWACNAEYDLVNLCGPWVGKMVTLTYRGSAGLLRGNWRDSRIQFYDTLRHWPMSVEQMGRYINLPKLDRLGTKGLRSEIIYCQRDTEIVWRFVRHMLARYDDMGLRLRSTLPSMALQLFEQQFYMAPWPVVEKPERDFFRRGYYGGRVEVYHFGPIKGPVHHYDVNSLFPSVMKEMRYPDVAGGFIRTTTPNWSREGMAEVTITVPETRYPPLPVRGGDELVYPYGTLQGVWAYPELRAALDRGCRILKVDAAIEYDALRRGQPFSKYIDFCYAQRRAATHALDSVFWKLMMNSLYGKFGQGEGLIVIAQDKEMTFGSAARQANVIWAAYVTSHARVRLLEFLESTTACYYTDTDSLFTPDVLPVSGELGKLKWEGTASQAQFYGNKLYLLWDYDIECAQCKGTGKVDGTNCTKCKARGRMLKDEVVKAKGVPPDAAGDFIRTGRAVYRKPIRYRESRHSFLAGNVWGVTEKERDDLYTKRRIFGNGTSWPWQWNLYQRVRIDDVESDPIKGGIGTTRTNQFDKPRRRR